MREGIFIWGTDITHIKAAGCLSMPGCRYRNSMMRNKEGYLEPTACRAIREAAGECGQL